MRVYSLASPAAAASPVAYTIGLAKPAAAEVGLASPDAYTIGLAKPAADQ